MTDHLPAIVDRELSLLREAFNPVSDMLDASPDDFAAVRANALAVQSNIREVIKRVDWLLCNGGNCITPGSRRGFIQLKTVMLGLLAGNITI